MSSTLIGKTMTICIWTRGVLRWMLMATIPHPLLSHHHCLSLSQPPPMREKTMWYNNSNKQWRRCILVDLLSVHVCPFSHFPIRPQPLHHLQTLCLFPPIIYTLKIDHGTLIPHPLEPKILTPTHQMPILPPHPLLPILSLLLHRIIPSDSNMTMRTMLCTLKRLALSRITDANENDDQDLEVLVVSMALTFDLLPQIAVNPGPAQRQMRKQGQHVVLGRKHEIKPKSLCSLLQTHTLHLLFWVTPTLSVS